MKSVALIAIAAGIAVTALPSAANPLVEARGKCEQKIGLIQNKLDSAQSWTRTLTIFSAIIGFFGSLGAGFLPNAKSKKVSAVVGALGATLGSVSQVLPNPTELATNLKHAAQHQTAGMQVYLQLGLGPDPGASGSKYSAARFVECASHMPSEKVEPIPSAFSRSGGGELGSDF
jgi:hypothetical protein